MSDAVESGDWSASGVTPMSLAEEPTFTIGQLAREFGVTFRALRFYESRGLIAPHREGHLRRYRQCDRERLALILRGKKLGFTLDEIAGMICSSGDGQPNALDLSRPRCVERINRLERKRRQIEAALADLRLAYTSPDHHDFERRQPRTA